MSERERERASEEGRGGGDELRRRGTVGQSAHGTWLAAGGELQREETADQRGMRLIHRFKKNG